MSNPTSIGTAHFRTIAHAERYYAAYDPDIDAAELRAIVALKIRNREIHIGPPNDFPAGTMLTCDRDGRYHIQTMEQFDTRVAESNSEIEHPAKRNRLEACDL
jgi:hypothetical protein